MKTTKNIYIIILAISITSFGQCKKERNIYPAFKNLKLENLVKEFNLKEVGFFSNSIFLHVPLDLTRVDLNKDDMEGIMYKSIDSSMVVTLQNIANNKNINSGSNKIGRQLNAVKYFNGFFATLSGSYPDANWKFKNIVKHKGHTLMVFEFVARSKYFLITINIEPKSLIMLTVTTNQDKLLIRKSKAIAYSLEVK